MFDFVNLHILFETNISIWIPMQCKCANWWVEINAAVFETRVDNQIQVTTWTKYTAPTKYCFQMIYVESEITRCHITYCGQWRVMSMCINLLCVLCCTCLLLTGHIRVNSQYQTGAVLQGQNFMIKIPVFCSD